MRAAFPALAVLTLVSLASPEASRGQTIPSPYTFIEARQDAGIYAGYLHAGTGRFGYGPSGGTVLGARYGIQLSGPLALEGNLGMARGTRDVISPSLPESNRAVGSANVQLVLVDARLRLSATGARAWHGLQPFLTFGGGMTWDTKGKAPADDLVDPDEVFSFRPSFLGVVGVGTRWFVTRKYALRTDATFSLWKLHTPGGFGDPQFGFEAVSTSEWAQGLSITGSLFFVW
jgi:hypothetical protein